MVSVYAIWEVRMTCAARGLNSLIPTPYLIEWAAVWGCGSWTGRNRLLKWSQFGLQRRRSIGSPKEALLAFNTTLKAANITDSGAILLSLLLHHPCVVRYILKSLKLDIHKYSKCSLLRPMIYIASSRVRYQPELPIVGALRLWMMRISNNALWEIFLCLFFFLPAM